MDVGVCTHVSVCVCVCMCVSVHACVCVWVLVCMRVSVCGCGSQRARTQTGVGVHRCQSMHTAGGRPCAWVLSTSVLVAASLGLRGYPSMRGSAEEASAARPTPESSQGSCVAHTPSEPRPWRRSRQPFSKVAVAWAAHSLWSQGGRRA